MYQWYRIYDAYIYQSIAVPEVRVLVQNAMLESAQTLHKHYGAELTALQAHITDLLYRFTNKALKDTCARVGGDPARKLSADDRLIGSSLLVRKSGAVPAYIAIGAAAGLHRLVAENSLEQSLENGKKLLLQTSGLDENNDLTAMILKTYQMILDGCSIAELYKSAEEAKAMLAERVI